jgi:hypothetical protein
MSKRDVERMFEEVREMAERLTAGEEKLATSQLADQLRQSGIDPDALKKRLHEAVKGIAARERAAGRVSPLAVQQAIEQTAPDDVIPSSPKAAEEKMGRWLERFGSGFSLPDQLEVARAYRKSGDVSGSDQADLDSLEEDLKERIKKKHDGEA